MPSRLGHPPRLPAIDRDRPTVLDPTDRHVDRWGEVADDGEPRERSPRLIGEPLRKLAVPEERLQQARHTTLDRGATGDHRRVVAQQLAGNVLAQLEAIDLVPELRRIAVQALSLDVAHQDDPGPAAGGLEPTLQRLRRGQERCVPAHETLETLV